MCVSTVLFSALIFMMIVVKITWTKSLSQMYIENEDSEGDRSRSHWMRQRMRISLFGSQILQITFAMCQTCDGSAKPECWDHFHIGVAQQSSNDRAIASVLWSSASSPRINSRTSQEQSLSATSDRQTGRQAFNGFSEGMIHNERKRKYEGSSLDIVTTNQNQTSWSLPGADQHIEK
jgi:hypothetical protein